MRSKRTLIASPPFAPTVLGQILQVLLISLNPLNTMIDQDIISPYNIKTILRQTRDEKKEKYQ